MKYLYLKGKDRVVTVGYEWERGSNRVYLAPIASCCTKDRFVTNDYGHHILIRGDQFNKDIARKIVNGRAKKYGMMGKSFVAENRKILMNKLVSIYHPSRSARRAAKKQLDGQSVLEMPF